MRPLATTSPIAAGNNALLLARDDTKAISVTGGVAGGFVGVGAGVGVTSVTKNTEASLGSNNVVNAGAAFADGLNGIADGTHAGKGFGVHASFHGLAVQAYSSEDFFGLTISIAGGFVGVAVPVGVTILHATTSASIGGGSTVTSGGSVDVSGLSSMKTITIAGGVAGGFVGVGAGVDIGIAQTSTNAFIGAGANVSAAGDVEVNALAYKHITTYALAIGGGFVGVSAAVSVWIVGTETVSTYNQDAAGPDKGNWSGSADYNKGDVVTGSDGKRYAAKVDHPSGDPVSGSTDWSGDKDAFTATGGPDATSEADSQASGSGGWASILNGTSAGSGNKTDSRIGSHTSDANASISASSPGPNVASTSIATTVPAGTSAAIDGHVTAGGNVKVNADDDLSYNGIAGAAAGGFVGVGASVLVGQVKAASDARIGSSAIISAGGQVSVHAGLTEDSRAIGFAAGLGAVGINSDTAVLNDSSSQNAHVDSGATISGTAGILVEAIAIRTVETDGLGVSSGAGSTGGSVAIQSIGGDTTASVGDATVGGLGLTVQAIDHLVIPTRALGISGGVFAGLSGVVAYSTLSGTTSATSGAHGTVGAGGVTVKADGFHDVSAKTINVSTGALAVGLTISHAADKRDTLATVTSTGNIASAGAVLVWANAFNRAVADAPGGSAGGVSVDVMLPIATVSAATRAQVDGDFTSSTSLTVRATAQNTATATVLVIGVSVIGLSGAYADAEITSSSVVEAKVGSTASLASTGAVTVDAHTTGTGNTATADAEGGTGGGIAALSVMVTNAEIDGAVRARLDGDVTGSASVLVTANGTNQADATTFMVGIAAFAGSGSGSSATIGGSAQVQALAGGPAIHSTGLVHLTATSHNTATASSDGGTGGIVAIGVNLPTATVSGGTTAQLDADVVGGTGVTVEAHGTNTATANADTVAIGALFAGAGAAADAEITASAGVTAAVGSSASISTAGAVQVSATAVNTATAKPSIISGSLLVSIAFLQPTAKVGGGTTATFAGTITSGASLSVAAHGRNKAVADADITGFSLGDTGSGAFADAEVLSSAAVKAGIIGGAHVTVAGAVGIVADNAAPDPDQLNYAEAKAHTIGVGEVAAGVMVAYARIDAGVHAQLDGQIHSSTSVTVTANGVNTVVGDAFVLGLGLVAISGGAAIAIIGSGASVTATGVGTIASSGLIQFDAISNNTATASSDIGSGGFVSLGVSLPTATISGGTIASFSGTVSGGTGLTVHADGTSNATAESFVIDIGIFFAGSGSSVDAEVTSGATVEAFIGAGSSVSLTSGTVNVSATSDLQAHAATSGGGGGVGSVTIGLPTAKVSASTLAFVGEGASVSASSLTIGATGTLFAEATSSSLNIGGITVQGLKNEALVTGTVEAFIGARSTQASSSTATVTVGGLVSVTASSTMTANASASGTSGGLASVGIMLPHAQVSGATLAYVREGVALSAGTLTIGAGTLLAPATYSATATTDVFGIAVVGGSGATPTAEITGTVDAWIGTPAGIAPVTGQTVTVTGAATVASVSSLTAHADAHGTGGGITTVSVLIPTATVGGKTRAFVGPATLHAGSLTVSATALAMNATADTTAFAVTLAARNGRGRDGNGQRHRRCAPRHGDRRDCVRPSPPTSRSREPPRCRPPRR